MSGNYSGRLEKSGHDDICPDCGQVMELAWDAIFPSYWNCRGCKKRHAAKI